MSEKVVIGNATLYHGDCMEILPTLGKVDAVVTDPPYNAVNRENSGLRNLDKGGADSLLVDVFALVDLVGKTGATTVYFWCCTEQVSQYRRALVDDGWSTRQAVWWKTNPSPMNGQHLWLSAVELCVYGKRRGGIFNKPCGHPVFKGAIEPNQSHPTQKPEWLMCELLAASSDDGQSILDPFMGSGTTGVACMNLGRKFIGIELERKYFDIACERIDAAQAQGRLFE